MLPDGADRLPRHAAGRRGLYIERHVHDFCSYRELAVRFDPDDPTAAAWAYAVADGLPRWLNADFLQPVVYEDRSQVAELACTDHFDAARRAMLLLERLRIDGYGTLDQAIRIAHLRAAYPCRPKMSISCFANRRPRLAFAAPPTAASNFMRRTV